MKKICDFINECGCFYVLTINGDFPAGRPFGAIMESDGKLYFSTNTRNEAHKQLRKNGNIQIIAKKDGTRDWLRITGTAVECKDLHKKQMMLDKCPNLSRHFSSVNDEIYLLFEVTVIEVEYK